MTPLTQRPLLKDQLFNAQKLRLLSQPLARCCATFDANAFEADTLAGFTERELRERIVWIRTQLRQHLPGTYRQIVDLLVQALPAPCDPTLLDNDFGDFIYAPYSDFVAHYGCTAEDLDFSLNALGEMTTRFSAEYAIRPFLNAFPEETLAQLQQWINHPHYHVRRLVSEGTRPRLPWGQKVSLSWSQCEPLLTALHADPTGFVRRSVANHLNDWSKTHPEQVLHCLQQWRKQQQASSTHLQYLCQHSLRTLVKQGNSTALALLGYDVEASYTVSDFSLTPRVALGEALTFGFTLQTQAKDPQRFVVDYVLFYRNKKGQWTPKVYKLKSCVLAPGETSSLQKSLVLQQRSTRTLYPGVQGMALQINGHQGPRFDFELHH